MHYHNQKCKLFAHTKLTIVSGPLMSCLATICMVLLNDVHLHITFLSDRIKSQMHFTNLPFSKIIQRPA